MVSLNHITKLPENAEWSYLYAIADVYKNYSSKEFDKNDKTKPHPLLDKEVIEILRNNYNLKNIHKNTISSTRKRLEQYFGFKFGTNKKGKYIVSQTNCLKDEDIFFITLIIKNSSLITTEKADELVNSLKSFASHTIINNNVNQIKTNKMAKKDNDLYNNIQIITKAISQKNKVIIDYKSGKEPLKIIPTKITIDRKDEPILEFENVNHYWWTNYYPTKIKIDDIRSLTVIKRGRPSKKSLQ